MLKSAEVKTGKKLWSLTKKYSLKLIFIKAMYFISGILLSRGAIFGKYYPFGISLSAAAPGRLLTPTVIGSVLGYLMPLKFGLSVRYISTVVAIAAVRWTLSDLPKIKNHFLYTPSVVFFSSLITGLAMNSAGGFDGRDVSLSFLEAFTAAGAAYFFNTAFKALAEKKFYSLNQKEFACVAVSASMVLLSLSAICIAGVSVGRCFAVALILICAYAMGVTGGGVSGIASGVIFSLPSFGLTYVSGSYAFGGMIAGLASSFGKAGVCAVFLFASTIVSFQSGDVSRMVLGLYESVIGIALFLAVPKWVFNKLKFSSPAFMCEENPTALKEAVAQRLSFASQSLLSVPQFINKASSKFLKPLSPDFKTAAFDSVYKACANCGLCTLCWQKEKDKTESDLNFAISLVSQKGSLNIKDLPDDFLKRCGKSQKLVSELSNSYEDFCSQKSAGAKIEEFKKIMSEQIEGTSHLIEDLSKEFLTNSSFDENLSAKIKSGVKKLGFEAMGVSCRKDESKRIFIEIKCKAQDACYCDKKLSKEISKICGRKFDLPIVHTFEEFSRVQICEEKTYDVDFGTAQHSFNNGRFCGDSCCSFKDGSGNFNVIISDGMGTGGKAAAEGTMVSKLMKNFIKSGMGFNSAVRLVNSAFLLRSGEESLATVDALSLNLFNGTAEFMKAGSPLTFIVKNGKVSKLFFESLPIGILSNVSFSRETVDLDEGDWIIMLSDGVTDIGEDFILDILKSKSYSNALELSRKIVDKSVKIRKEENHDDDITAVVLRLKRNN